MDPQQQQPTANQPYTTPDSSQGQFSPTEPPKNKKTGLIVAAVVAAVVVLGVILFVVLGSGKKEDSNKTTNNSSSSSSSDTASSGKYQKYDVTDKTTNLQFSVSFYKGAKVEEQNSRTYLNAGEEGSLTSVYLGAAKEGKIDCEGSPDTTMRLNGQASTICYKSDNTRYAGYVTVDNMTVRLNIAGQKAISMDEAKAIIESVTFN